MQRSLLNKVSPALFTLGLLVSLTTLFWHLTFLTTPDTTGGAGLVVICFELLALPIKWLLVTVIISSILNKPELNDVGASFAKNYGKMTLIQLVIMGGGLFQGAFTPFLMGILVLFQIMAPFLAARAIPGMMSRYDTKPMPTES